MGTHDDNMANKPRFSTVATAAPQLEIFHVYRGKMSVSFYVGQRGAFGFDGSRVLANLVIRSLANGHTLDGHFVNMKTLKARDVYSILVQRGFNVKSTYVPQAADRDKWADGLVLS